MSPSSKAKMSPFHPTREGRHRPMGSSKAPNPSPKAGRAPVGRPPRARPRIPPGRGHPGPNRGNNRGPKTPTRQRATGSTATPEASSPTAARYPFPAHSPTRGNGSEIFAEGLPPPGETVRLSPIRPILQQPDRRIPGNASAAESRGQQPLPALPGAKGQQARRALAPEFIPHISEGTSWFPLVE